MVTHATVEMNIIISKRLTAPCHALVILEISVVMPGQTACTQFVKKVNTEQTVNTPVMTVVEVADVFSQQDSALQIPMINPST